MTPEIVQLREVITKLVPMLAGKRIVVTQRGSQAYVEVDPDTQKPKRVNIPNISDNATADFVRAIQGFIDHEVAHVLITDWAIYGGGPTRAELANPKVRRFTMMHNIVEDTMIEREICKTFPGSRRNIADLRRHFIDKVTAPAVAGAKDEKEAFEYLLVPAMRALAGHEEFQDFMDKGNHWANPLIKALVDQLTPETKARLPKLTSTKQTYEVAREMEAILYPPEPPAPPAPPQPPQPQPPEPDKGEDSDEKGGKGKGKGKKEHGEDSDEATGGETGDEQEDGEDGAEPGKSKSKNEDKSDDADDEDGDAQSGKSESEKEESENDQSETSGADDGEDGDDDGKAEQADDDGDGDAADDGGDDGNDAGPDDSEDGDAAGDGDDDNAGGDDAGDNSDGSDRDGDDEAEDGEGNIDVVINDDEHDSIAESGGDTEGAGVGNGLTEHNIFQLDDDAFEKADISNQMAILLTKEAVDSISDSDYTVFTRESDRIEPLEIDDKHMRPEWVAAMDEKTRQMTGRMQKDIERMMASQSHIIKVPGFRSGKLHAPNLHRLLANDERIFNRRQEHKSKDTAVTLLIDNSGSMHGSKCALAMISAYALATTLERVGISNEVLGFTTGGYGSSAIQQELRDEQNKGINYCRTVPIMMPVYKSFDERINSVVKKRIAFQMNAQHGMAANVDGESLEYAAIRLMKRKEKRKVILVLSDGQPSGGHNVSGHLKLTTQKLEKIGIDLVGIGIMDASVRQFYKHAIVLNDVAELPLSIMQELKKILSK